MSAPLFLADRDALLAGERVEVTGPEGRHAVTVRRLRVGERVDLTDGEGILVAGRVEQVHAPDRLVVEVLERLVVPAPDPRFVVVQAIPKGERGELAVELLTEVGADAIVPWAAARCVAQWRGERGEKAHRRWVGTAREAAKQSRRAHVPLVPTAAATGDVVAMIAASSGAVVLHEEAADALVTWSPPPSGEVVVVVGPEGGLAPDEVEAFASAGAAVVRLGPEVMRTSTAGAAALSVLLSRSGRWA